MVSSEELQAAFGYLFPAEVEALKGLAQSLPDNPVVVNIGAGAGTSGLAFMESRDDLTLITIDIQKDDSPFGCLVAENTALREAGLLDPRRNLQIHLDSKEVGGLWPGRNVIPIVDGALRGPRYAVDMVFIDGDHSYNGCKGDILAWLPNIKKGGIMAVHDFDKKNVYKRTDLPDKVPHPLPWPGVDRAVRKFLCPHYEIVMHVDTLISFRIK